MKRRTILAAALSVFAQQGYTRAGIETIAVEAGVSTRTIYNHFRDKSELFQTVIEQSAGQVAQAQIEIVERYLGAVDSGVDLEELLVAFATDWTTPMPRYADHRALVGQVRAEAGHIPPQAIEAWQQAGPARVRAALAEAFEALAERGLLRTADPTLAALHFARLVAITDPLRPGYLPKKKQAADLIAAGVHTFLHGYGR